MQEQKFYNLTNPQKSIWVTEEYFKGSAINNICGTALIKENVNLTLLEKSIFQVLKNNDIFKFRFTLNNGEVQQYLSEFINSDIIYLHAKNNKEFETLKNEIVSKPFHLLNSHPYNFYIITFPNGQAAFSLCIHHILADSWTLGFLSKQIVKTYCALLQLDIPYECETYSYIDYINSEIQYKKSERFLKDKSFWAKEFETIPDIPSIPGSSNLSNSEETTIAKRTQFCLNSKEVSNIRNYCNKENISLFNFFMAIYSIYIQGISGLNDFCIGTPILNRTNFKEKNTAGMFINMAAFRIDFSNISTFKDFIKYISAKSLNMLKHQKYSYQTLIEDLRETKGNIPKLYNTVFSYQITNTQSKEIFVKNSTDWTFNGNSAEDITIQVFDLDNSGDLTISYDYKTTIYTNDDINNIHKRILNIINQVIKEKDIELKNIEILSKDENNLILNKFNKTNSFYIHSNTLVNLFEKQANRNPNNIAVIYDSKKYSYKELNEMSNKVANKIGNITGEKIAVLCNKSVQTLASFIGIMKSGNCYIPIDPEYPQERIEYILQNSSASMLITTHNTKVSFKDKIYLEDIFESNQINYANKSTPDSLAYIIYTSGTTGNPKGVKIKHKNIINTLLWRKRYYNFNKNTTVYQIPSFSFDSSVEDIFTPLISGSKLIIPSTPKIDINKMCEDIKEYNVQNFLVVPSLYKILLKEKAEFLKPLKFITIAGEDFNMNLVKEHFEKLPGVRLVNEYGPTENSVCSTYYELKPEDTEIYIGKPISNCKCYCLNSNLKPLPVNTQGELYVSGPGVSEGYLNKDDITKERFLENPFGGKYKLYKTGDIVEYNDTGDLKFIGRNDNQIKLHGFRIELKEIEKNILKNPKIIDTFVTKKFDLNDKPILVAYVISKNNNLDISNLTDSLKKALPQYMVPKIVQIERFPLTPNGKIDTKALPLPSSVDLKKEIIKPRNDIDKRLIKLLQETFDEYNISLLDTVYTLGGDSLSAISLSAKIASEFGTEISIKDLLSDLNFKDLSDKIKNTSSNYFNQNVIEKVEKRDFYPLSSAQRRIYYNTKMINEKNTVYNVPGSILIDKIISKEKLQNIFETLIKRHSSLRTYFEIVENEIVQKIAEKVDFDIPVYENTFSEIESIKSKFSKPFKLEKAPLFRVEVHYIDNSKTLLLMDSHHIIMDGASLNNLVEEFNLLYKGELLPELPIEYTDYSVWENNFNSSTEIEKLEKYWLQKFDGCDFSELNLPFDYNEKSNKTYRGVKISKKIDTKYFKKIHEMSSLYGVSPYMVFLSAFFVLLYKYTGQTDINIGTPFANRDLPETSKLLGMFVNNLVLRGKIDKNKTFKDFLLDIKKQVLSDLSNQPYPYDMLVKKVSVHKSSLFDAYFIYQNSESTSIKIDNKEYEISEIYNPNSKFNLSFEIKPATNTINLEYRTDLFKQETIDDLFLHYMNLLTNIIKDADKKISDISIMSNDEIDTIIHKFNNTKLDYDKSKTISQLFEEQVEKTPNRIALVSEDKKLTYKQLNEKANQLANYLRSKGIIPNNIVGIMLPRSLDILVAILGVLKSGGCYIPIDPTYPEQRIEYMLQNSNTKLVITTDELFNNINFENKINIYSEEIYAQNDKNLQNINNPDDLAYLIYTSGSTGLPKGVMLKHQNVTNLAAASNVSIDFLKENCEYKNMVSVTTVSFDIFVFETLICLQKGLKVVIANEDEQRIPALLDKLIQKNDIQLIQTTPSIMQILLDNIIDMPHLQKLQYINLIGEQLPLHLRNDLLKLNPKKIYNEYGPTETTVFSSLANVTHSKEITIGKTISNTQMYILDSDLNPVPIGVAGELYIAGDGVGHGYLGKPDITAKSYMSNPFIPNSIMYKTGDLCKYDKSGNIYCLGRLDNQIKIRGLRIELEEIENKILAFPDVKKVKVIKQEIGNREIISAYYISTKKIKISELRRYLYTVLPKYMIPSYFTALDSFPYTPNGKVDKKALPVPTGVLQSKSSSYVAPKTDMEIKLVSIWEDLLNTKPIGIKDNFFELGGDSILAMNLNILLRKETNKITYSDIFRYPTISDLIEKMETDNNITKDDQLNNLDEKYSELLENNMKLQKNVEPNNIGNVLLTGGTGFLGIHILSEFLKVEKGKIYLIVRKDPGQSVKDKLIDKLHYYFGNKYDKYIDTRIVVIEGNISEDGFGLNQDDLFKLGNSVNTIINSAAKVAHYGNYQDFYNANVKSVEKIIDFANLFNLSIFHISTLSVSGDVPVNGHPEFSEKDFYIGQDLANVYVKSKFEAEKLLLDAVLKGTKAYILRLGNLMPRRSDGKFQDNIQENAFISRLKAFVHLKMLPIKLSNSSLEFTPVDDAAIAILKILKYTKPNNIIYHIFNPNYLSVNSSLKKLSDYGLKIELVDDDKFREILLLFLLDPRAYTFNSLANDLDKDSNLNYDKINIQSVHSTKFLKSCGFEWSKIDKDYILKILKLIKGD